MRKPTAAALAAALLAGCASVAERSVAPPREVAALPPPLTADDPDDHGLEERQAKGWEADAPQAQLFADQDARLAAFANDPAGCTSPRLREALNAARAAPAAGARAEMHLKVGDAARRRNCWDVAERAYKEVAELGGAEMASARRRARAGLLRLRARRAG